MEPTLMSHRSAQLPATTASNAGSVNSTSMSKPSYSPVSSLRNDCGGYAGSVDTRILPASQTRASSPSMSGESQVRPAPPPLGADDSAGCDSAAELCEGLSPPPWHAARMSAATARIAKARIGLMNLLQVTPTLRRSMSCSEWHVVALPHSQRQGEGAHRYTHAHDLDPFADAAVARLDAPVTLLRRARDT